LGNLSIVIFLS